MNFIIQLVTFSLQESMGFTASILIKKKPVLKQVTASQSLLHCFLVITVSEVWVIWMTYVCRNFCWIWAILQWNGHHSFQTDRSLINYISVAYSHMLSTVTFMIYFCYPQMAFNLAVIFQHVKVLVSENPLVSWKDSWCCLLAKVHYG